MKEKMEKKSSRHGKTAFKQKCQNEPNNQTDEDKNKEHNTKVMSQGTKREKKGKLTHKHLPFLFFQQSLLLLL